MNCRQTFFLLPLSLLMICCNYSKTSTVVNKSSVSNATIVLTSYEPKDENSIVGEWELKAIIFDSNANDKIEEDEKQKASTESHDYMKLNSDGSAVFYTIKIKGRYEIKTNSSSGYRYLNLFTENNDKVSKGRIFSVTKDELTLLDHFGGSTFHIYKRI
jgi:hypothetical protein